MADARIWGVGEGAGRAGHVRYPGARVLEDTGWRRACWRFGLAHSDAVGTCILRSNGRRP